MIKRVESMSKFFKINESLPDLLIGILIFGLFAEFLPVWFLERKLYYSIGLLIGLFVAALSAWHMAYSIDNAVDYDEGTATKQMQKGSALRYGGWLILLGVLMIFDFASPIAAFIGMISLKVSAYLAPFTHKLFRR